MAAREENNTGELVKKRMRSLLTHIKMVLLCVIAGSMFTACIYDAGEELCIDEQADGVQFVFNISALGADASQRQGSVSEVVKSLRVVVIDSNSGRLDINEKVNLPEQYAAKTFIYTFIRSLNSGAKQLFLIANEESVAELLFAAGPSDIPEDVPQTSLTAMLDYFEADSEEEARTNYTGELFAEVLNRAYFKNTYSIEDGEIALPYSAYYELNESELYDKNNNRLTRIEKSMYLVPVASKFDFVFTNFRKEAACIDDVIISSVNSHNYLNAQLANAEKRRTMPDGTKNVWWIDWLEVCAAGSHTADDLEPGPNDDSYESGGYNGRWGWIRDYKMPVADEKTVALSLRGGVEREHNDTDWTVGRLINIKTPPAITKGPYYVPESFNHPSSYSGSEDDLRQYYSLTFKVHDEGSDEVQLLEDFEIDTLGALFRDTHIIIYVEFYESKAEIYAEIAPWDEVTFVGYVQQDEDY